MGAVGVVMFSVGVAGWLGIVWLILHFAVIRKQRPRSFRRSGAPALAAQHGWSYVHGAPPPEARVPYSYVAQRIDGTVGGLPFWFEERVEVVNSAPEADSERWRPRMVVGGASGLPTGQVQTHGRKVTTIPVGGRLSALAGDPAFTQWITSQRHAGELSVNPDGTLSTSWRDPTDEKTFLGKQRFLLEALARLRQLAGERVD